MMKSVKIPYLRQDIADEMEDVEVLITDERNNWIAIRSNGEVLSSNDAELKTIHGNCNYLANHSDKLGYKLSGEEIERVNACAEPKLLRSVFGPAYDDALKTDRYRDKQMAECVAFFEDSERYSYDDRATKREINGASWKEGVTREEKCAKMQSAIKYQYENLGKRINALFERYDKENGTNLDNARANDYSNTLTEPQSNRAVIVQKKLRGIAMDENARDVDHIAANDIMNQYRQLRKMKAEFDTYEGKDRGNTPQIVDDRGLQRGRKMTNL